MSARISDTVCRCRTAALFVIIIQLSFLSVDIGKLIPSVNAAANNTEKNFNQNGPFITRQAKVPERKTGLNALSDQAASR